jgi:hypothetical protein
MKEMAWSAVVEFIRQNEASLRVDVSELSAPNVGVFEGGQIIQIHSQRALNGIPVRDSGVTAFINHGNLVLFGLQNWGDAGSVAAGAQIAAEQGKSVIAQHAQPHVIESWSKGGRLEYIPMVRGEGYEYRLVWALKAGLRDDHGTWEGLVDAVSGELIAFEDKNQYAARKVIGGVYPVSNDQRPPDGIEQVGWPMPFANVTTTAGTMTTNSAGTLGCVSGNISTALVGRYARMNDACGAINETATGLADIDLGSGPTPLATDCTVPAGHSAGDTKASRTGFYELTRLNEHARGWLPNNPWLQTSLQANMNIINSCNAFWNGSTVNFYRSSGTCRNTGEQAAIFDHEWGHGMDDFGTVPGISSPGEAIADIHAAMRLGQSCVGRGFFINQTCGGYGDPCDGTPANGCTGVRDIEFMNHRCNQPHTITWAQNGFTSAQCGGTGPAPACPAGGGTPCGRETHCEGMIAAETGWDLYARDLQAAPFNFDVNTALEIATRLNYLGSQSITSWNTCAVGGGCGASNGYMLYLAADDDDGNIQNGTPHMSAIRAAFERHEIHCTTPAVANTGCAGGPTTAPVVTFVPQDSGVILNWNAVAGATRYYVYRTEGVNGSGFGKIKIAEVTGTTYTDTQLANGRGYFYTVLPVGSNAACLGRMSVPASVTPVAGPNMALRSTTSFTVAGGDGDGFLDNCESATVTFTVENTGTGPLTNVRLTAVQFLTHTGSVLNTPLPSQIAASLPDNCGTATGTFNFTLNGAAFNDTIQMVITVTADQLAGQTRTQTISIGNLETDSQAVASRTYNFDADMSGWTVVSGTFNRQAPGAQGTPFHLSSSGLTPNQCDVVRSPAIRLSATSTLALFNRFEIEPTDPTMGPYDRANVGIRPLDTGVRQHIVPSGGQLYTTNGQGTGQYDACELTGQPGWNGTSPGFPNTFNESTWNSGAMNPGGVFTNRLAYIEIRYGVDPGLHLAGFDFDQVTVTNIDDLVPDVVPNVCIAQNAAPFGIAVDAGGNGVYQPNETVEVAPAWRNIGTNAITLTGALSNHTGPAGATYTIPDAAASYGTIAVNGNASCTASGNCYSVANTAATRPQVHWDSTALETVSPSANTKTWTLHIGESFTDVTGGPFFRFVETLLHNGVTGGCTATTYCPSASTTRAQMAVFVLVSKEGPTYSPAACVAGQEVFADVPSTSPFCRWIEELADRGVVAGCGGNNYCPANPVSRDQMAVFVLRTLDPTLTPPACVAGQEQFGDVPATSAFCRWIEELANRQVVTGCGGGNYCPTSPVSREQMGVFLAVTFGLTLYGL